MSLYPSPHQGFCKHQHLHLFAWAVRGSSATLTPCHIANQHRDPKCYSNPNRNPKPETNP